MIGKSECYTQHHGNQYQGLWGWGGFFWHCSRVKSLAPNNQEEIQPGACWTHFYHNKSVGAIPAVNPLSVHWQRQPHRMKNLTWIFGLTRNVSFIQRSQIVQHRNIQSHSDLKRPLEVASSTSCPKQDNLWDQSRVFKVCSSCGLRTPKGRGGIIFLGNLLHCLAALVGKMFFTSSLKLFSFKLMPVISHPAAGHRCENPSLAPQLPPYRHWGAVRCLKAISAAKLCSVHAALGTAGPCC